MVKKPYLYICKFSEFLYVKNTKFGNRFILFVHICRARLSEMSIVGKSINMGKKYIVNNC